MPSQSIIIKQMRALQERLARREESQFDQMAKRWLQVENALEGQMSALALSIQNAALAGTPLSLEQIRRLDRYAALLSQARSEVDKYTAYAEKVIRDEQRAVIEAGWKSAVEAVQAARPNDWQEFITRLPSRSVENMIGLAGDGSPLATLLKEAYGDAVRGVDLALVRAMAEGWNPNKTARAMADGLAGGLDRALLIARTEQMRAYRESTRMGYQSSGIVKQYKRMASKSVRTCVACLVADGTVYDVESDFEEHPNGRCTLVPVVDGVEMPNWESGASWLEKQDAETQKTIMGPLYDPWITGQIELQDMVSRHEDATWGAYLRPTALKDLMGSMSSGTTEPPEPVAPSGPEGPNGPAVSEAFNVASLRSRAIREEAALALEQIDSVHGDGQLPKWPLAESSSHSFFGAFYTQGGRAVKIALSKTGDHQAFTFIHEIGHFLDHSAADRMWSSLSSAGENAAIIQAAKNSNWMMNFLSMVHQINNRSSADAYVVPISSQYASYLLRPQEIYARAYAQYIATKSQNPVLLEQLKKLQDAKFPTQWTDEDFAPIAQVFDELFKEKGWIK